VIQIGQDNSINVPHIILGWFGRQTQISPEVTQIIAKGKQRFYSFIEFYAMQLKNQGVKL